jgi:lysozyme
VSESAEALAAGLAESAEGEVLHPYQDPAGVWTIGEGSTRDLDGNPVTSRTPPITKEQADKLLQRDMASAFDAVRGDVKVPLTPAEEAALADFVYNLGAGNFERSTLLKLLNRGDFEGAAKQFARWDTANGEALAGLARRRAAEAALFEQGVDQVSGSVDKVATSRGAVALSSGAAAAQGPDITAWLNAEEAAIGPDNPGPAEGMVT